MLDSQELVVAGAGDCGHEQVHVDGGEHAAELTWLYREPEGTRGRGHGGSPVIPANTKEAGDRGSPCGRW